MAFKAGRLTTVYWNGSNLTTLLNSASLSGSCETGDTSTFGSSWMTAIPTLMGAEASFSGYHDPDVAAPFSTLGTAGGVLTYCPAGGYAIADMARLISATSTSHETSTEVGGVVTWSWDVTSDAAVGIGKILHVLGEDTNTTTGATRDDGASSATGWIAHLHVTAVDGGSWVIKLQGSPDGSSWGDVTNGAFTAATTATAERITAASDTTSLSRYLRYVATRTGGSAGDGITFALAYARNM